MAAGLTELLGLFLAIVGGGLIVGACALVATWLALLVAGVFCLFTAIVVIYVANATAAKRTPVRTAN